MKKKFLPFIILMFANFISAQEVEIKDDKVLLEGKAILKAEKINAMNYSFFTLNDDEILMYKYSDNETPNNENDNYFVLNFIEQRKKIESSDFSRIASFGFNSKKVMQKLIKWLVKDKVITSEGKIDDEKLSIFIDKYDEKILERTLR
jgi:hypothetical protein